jgi:activator of HSP90 ATPase
MATSIIHTMLFENTTAAELYSLYMDVEKHTEVTGAATVITEEEEAEYSCYDDYITGVNLKIVKNTLVVQTWRADDWDEETPESYLTLYFEQDGDHAIVHMVHANLPDDDADNIDSGWHEFYWEPWKEFLAR